MTPDGEPRTDPALDLPEVHEALLDDATVDRLFDDVAACAELLGVAVKAAAHSRARDRPSQDAAAELAAARAALAAGGALGVQLRYRHDGAEWWDTLVRAPGGVRLVRIRCERRDSNPHGLSARSF